MNKIKIPKQFEIGGRTVTVEYDPRLIDRYGDQGQAIHRENKIVLHQNTMGADRPEDHNEETYLHEITHMILNMMEERELVENEKFVSIFSQYLHQIFKTSIYE